MVQEDLVDEFERMCETIAGQVEEARSAMSRGDAQWAHDYMQVVRYLAWDAEKFLNRHIGRRKAAPQDGK